MRIGLLSDTHIAWEEKEIPRKALDMFQGVDLILHGGDIYAHAALDELEKIAPVYAAQGDDDYDSDDPRIQEKHVLEIDGVKIWLIHEGPFVEWAEEWTTKWWQQKIKPDDPLYGRPDIIISGHEHRAFIENSNGIICMSSGSPNLLHYRRGPGTIGMLEIKHGKPKVEIIHL